MDDDGDGTFDRAEKYVYDGADVVLVFDDTGSLTTRYLHGPAVDQVFASEGALGEILWALPDNQGTVRDIAEYDSGTDTTSVVNHIKYDSFGIITSESDPSVDFMYSYTGRVWDADAELYYYRARWYDAPVGRFISEDPIGFLGGDTNLSRYVANSPTNFVDPSGLDWLDDYARWFNKNVASRAKDAVSSLEYFRQAYRETREYNRRLAQEKGYSNLFNEYYGEVALSLYGNKRMAEQGNLADDIVLTGGLVTEGTSWIDPTPTSDGVLTLVYIVNGQRQEAAFQVAAMAVPGGADKALKHWDKLPIKRILRHADEIFDADILVRLKQFIKKSHKEQKDAYKKHLDTYREHLEKYKQKPGDTTGETNRIEREIEWMRKILEKRGGRFDGDGNPLDF